MSVKHIFFAGVMLLVSQGVMAAQCEIALVGNDAMQFDKKEVTVDAGCNEYVLKLVHAGKLPKSSMGHNVVISKESDKKAVAIAGMNAGATKSFVSDDMKVIAHTKLLGGGEKTEIKFAGAKLVKGESYVYFCTFPGHFAMMTGTLIVK